MTTYNTGNQIGSTDARDRSDNSENLDMAVNSLSQTFTDRLGVTRDTLEGIYQKSAYYRAGTFDDGYTLTNNRQTLAYGNIEYSWSGAFPKVVTAGSTPLATGGIGAGAWVDRTQDTLADELASIDGDSKIGHATYQQIRDYAGVLKSIRCGGRSSLYSGDGAHGKFFRDDSDTTSLDNDGTILVDALNRRWKRKYTGRAAGEWFGVTADNVTTNDTAVLKAVSFASLGNPLNLAKKQGVIRLAAPVLASLVDNTTVDIDFCGATIKPLDTYNAGTSDKLLQLNGGNTLLANCTVNITNPSFDSSNIAPVNAVTPETRKGIGGLLVQAAHTVNITNSKAKGQFYSASIFVNVFNTLNIDGHQATDCGVKYSALTDYVGLYDAAGDAIYTANAVGAAKVSLKNINSSSQSAYLGRAGFVSESGGAASSISVKLDNCNFDGYQRITHQEDGAKSSIEWDGGTASRFSVLNFTLGETKKRAVKVKNVHVPDINPTITYGGKAGVYAGDSQDQAGAPFASYEECKLGYSTALVGERYGAEYIRSHIVIGPSVAISKVACNDTYTDCDFEFTNSAGRIYYSNNSLVTISGGTSKCATANKTAWDLLGGALTIKNGHKSKNCLPQVSSGTELSHYEGVYDLSDGSGVTGEIFIGSSHKREFVDARIICPTTGFIELKGNAGVVNKLMDNVQTEGVVINYDTHNTFDTRASTRNLTQRFPVGNTPSVSFQYSNSPQVVHFGYLLDRNNASVAIPASSGNIKYVGSAACNSDGTITAIT